MAKSIVGIDIGYDRLKLALVAGKKVRKTAIVEMPENMVRQGHVVSVEAMGELIRDTMKENGIRCRDAAVILSEETCFVRNVVMPIMSEEQLVYNLPYEFRDYITDELKKYVYDYAMLTDPAELKAKAEGGQNPSEDGEPADRTMELLATAIPKDIIEDDRVMVRKASMKMIAAAPSVDAYARLLTIAVPKDQESCILDLGYHGIRMYMYKGDSHNVTRKLESGLSGLDDIIADQYNVDVHLAHTYFEANHENCQYCDACMNSYNSIAIELMRALNFYQFSNPDSKLQDLYICGGGTLIEPLLDEIRKTLSINLHMASELISGGDLIPECDSLTAAIGIALS